MADQKNIAVVLQAKLEAGNTFDEAAKIGDGIKKELAKAFSTLGSDLAKQFFLDFQKELNSSMRLLDWNGNRGAAPPTPRLLDPSGNPLSTADQAVAAGAVSAAQVVQQMVGSNTTGVALSGGGPAAQVAQSRVASSSIELVRSTGMGKLGVALYNSPKNDRMGYVNQEGRDALYESDVFMGNMDAAQLMRRIRPNAKISSLLGDPEKSKSENKADMIANIDRIKDQADKEGEKAFRNILELNKEINALKKAVENNTASNREAVEQKDRDRSKLSDLEKQRSAQYGALAGAAADKEAALASDPRLKQFLKSPEGQNMAMQAVQTAIQVGEFMADFNLMRMRGEAGTAEAQNFGTRTLMNRDFVGIAANQRLGGEERMRSQAERDTNIGIGTKLGGGAALMALAAIAGTAATGGLALPVMLGLGGVGLGLSGAKDAMEYDARVSENMKTQQELERTRGREYYGAFETSRNLAVRSYQAANALGTEDLSSFLYGGGPGGIREHAVSKGVTNQAVDQALVTLASSMGGQFYGQSPSLMDEGLESSLKRNVALKSQGLPNADVLATMMFQGSALSTGSATGDRQEALDRVEKMMERAVASGMDRTQMANYLQRNLSRTQGQGAADFETNRLDRALGTANYLYGANGRLEQSDLDIVGRTQQAMGDATRQTGNTLGTAAGIRMVQQMRGLLKNSKMGTYEEKLLQTSKIDREGLASLFPNESQETVDRLYETSQRAPDFYYDMVKRVQGKGAADLSTAFLSGEETLSGRVKAVKAARTGVKSESERQEAIENLRRTDGDRAVEEIFGIPTKKDEFQERGLLPGEDPFLAIQNEINRKSAQEAAIPGKAFSIAEQKTEATQMTEGFRTLKEVLPAVNSQMDIFIGKLRSILLENPQDRRTAQPGSIPPRADLTNYRVGFEIGKTAKPAQ